MFEPGCSSNPEFPIRTRSSQPPGCSSNPEFPIRTRSPQLEPGCSRNPDVTEYRTNPFSPPIVLSSKLMTRTRNQNVPCIAPENRLVELIFGLQIHRVPFIEQDRLHDVPNLRVTPVFTQNIRWVFSSVHVVESENIRTNRFANSVVRQCRVSLVELRVWNHTAVHD